MLQTNLALQNIITIIYPEKNTIKQSKKIQNWHKEFTKFLFSSYIINVRLNYNKIMLSINKLMISNSME